MDEDEPSVSEDPCRILRIRYFEGAKDWCHKQEVNVDCNENGDLNLVTVLEKLHMNGKVIVRIDT